MLLIGAGFDSRGIRFQSELKDARIFELDAPTTQSMKVGQYGKRGIEVPSNLSFIPINFEKESLVQKLNEAGFIPEMKTLVVLEGVLQYLKPEAAFATFETIKNQTGRGSWLVFDFAHAAVLQAGENRQEKDEMLKHLDQYGESWQFGLEDAEVERLLSRYNFKLLDLKGPQDLEKVFFTDDKGVVRTRINGTQSIVKAERL